MYKLLVTLMTLMLLSGCAGHPRDNSDPKINDPFSGFNRSMWDLNYDVLDPYIIKPVANTYELIPSPGRKGISNFISNLSEPIYTLSSLFMLHPVEALQHLNRFWINTFFGLGGLIDIAGRADINPKSYGVADALGYYGVGKGPFLVLPFLGPTTPRNLVGSVASLYVPPKSELTTLQAIGVYTGDALQTRIDLKPQEFRLQQAQDSYLFMRNAYLQHQDYKANGGVEKIEKVDKEEDALLDEYLEMDE